MKKLAILGLSAIVGLAFSACDNYEEPNPAPQSNPQSTVLQTTDLNVATAVDANTTLNLTELNATYTPSTIATIATDMLPEGYKLKAVGTLAANGRTAQFATEVVPATDKAGIYDITVYPDVLNAAYKELTKAPATGTVNASFLLYTVAELGNQEAIIGGEKNVYGPYEFKVTPFAPAVTIEDSYTLVIGDNGKETTYVLAHAGEGSVYDTPTFSVKINATAGQTWKVAGPAYAAGGQFWGVEAGQEYNTSGKLLDSTVDPALVAAGQFTSTMPNLFSVNMETKEYSYTIAIDQLYTPGNSNGWSQTASQILTTTDFLNYTGFAVLDGEFKFSSQPNWDGINYGSTGKEGELTTDGGAGNLMAPSRALYWCTANLSALTYSIAACNSWGLIGDATPGGWDAETTLTPSADLLKYTGTVAMKGSGEFKLRANNAWDIDLGGQAADLQYKGANMPTPGEGTFDVVLDFSTVPYTVTFTKK